MSFEPAIVKTTGPRLPPHSVEAEMAALASMMQARDVLDECIDTVKPDYFYVPAHHTIFWALFERVKQNKSTDLVSLTNALRDGLPLENAPEMIKRGRLMRNEKPVITLEEIGGASYLTDLYAFVPTAANVRYYVEILREKYLLREIIARCTEVVRVAYDEQTEIAQVLEQAQQTLTQIIIDSERGAVFRDLKQGVQELMEKLEYAYWHKGKPGETVIDGVATGIYDFDRMTHGLKPQQLIVIGARPSQGKTAMAMQIAKNVALENQMPVGVFSIEMSYSEVIERLFASTSGISINKMRDGMLERHEKEVVAVEAGAKLVDAQIWLDDTPALSIPSFKARARMMKTRLGVRLIVVDYLQLMHSPTKRAQEQMRVEVTEISGALKAVAKELNVPVIACCQLNREAEARDSSFCKPKMSDLRESGSIEQDADIVVLLWRPVKHISRPKFNENLLAKTLKLRESELRPGEKERRPLWKEKDEKPGLSPEQISERDCQLEEYMGFLVVKQRNGPVEDLRLRFLGELTQFQNVTKKQYSSNPEERQQ